MALVCPVNHPPGVGTTFCRLCGRPYLVVPDSVPEEQTAEAAPVEVPQQKAAPSVAVAAARPAAPTAAPARPPAAPPTQAAAPLRPGPVPPPEAAARALVPAEPPARPTTAPEEPTVALPLVLPVSVPHGVQVHLPLRQVGPTDAAVPAPESPGGIDAEPSPPEDKLPRVRRELDRAVLLVGVAGGFLGGAVSGGAVAYLLS